MSALGTALRSWRALLGDEHVVTTTSAVAAAARATFPTAHAVAAIVRPRSSAELAAIVRTASQRRIPIHVISGGRNWGYGSRAPFQNNSVIVDLGRMNQIVDHDEKLGYVVLEAGVTFAHLREFLRNKGSSLLPLSVGSSPHASVIGNTLERGFGAGGYADRMANVCGLEVILPTGERIETGFARFAGARAAHVHRWGLGPSVDGLFSQASLGIVTRLAVWLKPQYPLTDTIHFSVERERAVPAMLDALQRLRMRGILRDGCAISSRARVTAAVQQYPWADARQRTPLPRNVVAQLRRAGVRRWMGWAVTGYQNTQHRRVERRLVRESLAEHVDQLVFRPAGGAPPTHAESRLPYWRKRTAMPHAPDPDADRCGVIMLGPVVPFDGREVASVARTVEKILLAHGLDPVIQLQCTNERSVVVNSMLLFDRDVIAEEKRAVACHAALQNALEQRGYFAYRASSLVESGKADGLRTLLASLKAVMDPAGILAAGRPFAP